MNKKTKILLLIIFVAIICSVYLTFMRSFVYRNFEIINSSEEAE